MTRFEFADKLGSYCFRTRASVTSYLRTVEHNRAVGGVPGSAHLYGLAADVVYDDARRDDDRREIGARLGLLVIIEGDHDHLQPMDWPRG